MKQGGGGGGGGSRADRSSEREGTARLGPLIAVPQQRRGNRNHGGSGKLPNRVYWSLQAYKRIWTAAFYSNADGHMYEFVESGSVGGRTTLATRLLHHAHPSLAWN